MGDCRTIQTVTGPIHADELGIVMSHEHLFWGWPGWLGDSTCKETYQETIEALRPEVESVKAFGVKTIVDGTTNETGRDPLLLKEIAQAFDINIICPSGYYNQEYGASMYFRRRRSFGCDVHSELKEMYQRELYDGIGNTGVRAGILKLATSPEGMTRYEEMFFEAACALACENRDIRIFVHHSCREALDQTSTYFVQHGVDPRQVYLGHACCSGDLDQQIGLIKAGFYLGYDQFGMKTQIHQDNAVRYGQLLELLRAGCEDKLLISTDRTRHDLGRANAYPNDKYSKLFITDHWSYLFETAIPELESRGMTQAQRDKLLRKNPAHFFGDILD